jgi:UDP-glucose 4-epimerase
LKISPNLNFGNTKRGWPGDSVYLHLDISKAKVVGWTPKYGVEATVRETARWVNSNTWLFDLRT